MAMYLPTKRLWRYNRVQDARTARVLLGGNFNPRGAVTHDPMDDCRAQIETVVEAYSRMRHFSEPSASY